MLRTIGNYREFTIGLAGLAVLLLTILILGAAGWPGGRNTCYQTPGHCYCENIIKNDPGSSPILTHPGVFAQPVNTWSNIGFMLVGLAMLWWIGWERATGRLSPHHNMMTRGTLFATMYGAFTVFLGPGSMMFHASMRQWAGWFDPVSMNLFMAFIPAYNLVRRFNWPRWAGVVVYLVANVIEGILNAVDIDHSLIWFAILGGIALVSQILVLFSPIQTSIGGRIFFAGGAVAFVAAFVIWALSWTEGPLCDPNSLIQGHGVWHLLSAVAVGCLYMYFRMEDSVSSRWHVPDYGPRAVQYA
jgi:hypothetical protein